MLTNLDFLSEGRPWPPPGEEERLTTYEQNRKLFAGDHGTVFREQFKRIERVTGNFENVIRYEYIVNYFRLISTKTADLLFSEPPTISVKEGDDAAQTALTRFLAHCPLTTRGYISAIDVSRYGDGPLKVALDAEGRGNIYPVRADCWMKVVHPENIHETKYHVIATPYAPNPEEPENRELLVEIHGRGTIETRRIKLDGQTLGATLEASGEKNNGLDAFAIVVPSNLIVSDGSYGIDDYAAVESLVAEIEVRAAQIARILDKHAAPSMQGPDSALSESPPGSGNYVFKAGNYFINQTGGSDKSSQISYITWDAELAAAFQALDWAVNQLRIISEMGAMLSDLSDKSGAVPSGSALRRLMANPIAKAARLRVSFDAALKEAIRLATKLDGAEILDVSITWFDGLPDDPLETAQIASVRAGGKQTRSVVSTIMDVDGKSLPEAEGEYRRILDERADEDAQGQAAMDSFEYDDGAIGAP